MIENGIQGQEAKYIETFLTINSDLGLELDLDRNNKTDSSNTNPVEELKTFTAKLLFDRKFTVGELNFRWIDRFRRVDIQVYEKLQELESMLKMLVDLRGVLFLYLFENPDENIDPDQVQHIYTKTKRYV